jgi:hypothetical protein
VVPPTLLAIADDVIEEIDAKSLDEDKAAVRRPNKGRCTRHWAGT